MARQVADVLLYLRHIAGADEADEQSDGGLLQRFVAHRDEAAFAALLAFRRPTRQGKRLTAPQQRTTGKQSCPTAFP